MAAPEEDVLRARNRTLQTRPEDVKAFFKAQFRGRVAAEPARERPAPMPLAGQGGDDPYGF